MSRAAPLVLLALLLLPIANAHHCGEASDHWSQTVVNSPSGHYVAIDHCRDMCVFSIWVYEESNGEPGLQRGDEVYDSTCGGRNGDADTILF